MPRRIPASAAAMLRLIAIASLALALPATSQEKRADGDRPDSLTFLGGYWDTADSFSLRFDLSQQPAVLEWDGYPDPAFAYRYHQQKNKPIDASRLRFSLVLDAAEDQLVRRVSANFHHCDRNTLGAIGTGLCTTAIVHSDGEQALVSYFHIPREHLLARAAEAVPMEFQLRVTRKGIDSGARHEFFRYLRQFDEMLSNYAAATRALRSAMSRGSAVDWQVIWEKVNHDAYPDLRKAIDRNAAPVDSKAETSRQTIDREMSGLLTAYAAHRSAGGSRDAVFSIDTMGTDSAAQWGALSHRGPGLLRSPDGAWACLPVELKLLIEDFIENTGSRAPPFEGRHPHPVFELPKLDPEEHRRLHFVEASGLYDFLIGGAPSARRSTDRGEPRLHKVLRLGISTEGDRSVLYRRDGDEYYFDEMVKSDSGAWEHRRTLSFDEYEQEMQQARERARILELNGGRDLFEPPEH